MFLSISYQYKPKTHIILFSKNISRLADKKECISHEQPMMPDWTNYVFVPAHQFDVLFQAQMYFACNRILKTIYE